jgi:hypothetical protein
VNIRKKDIFYIITDNRPKNFGGKKRGERNLFSREITDANALIHSPTNQWEKNENAH